MQLGGTAGRRNFNNENSKLKESQGRIKGLLDSGASEMEHRNCNSKEQWYIICYKTGKYQYEE